MSRIGPTLAKRKALIPYLTVGYPSLETTLKTVPLLAGWGCDIVELGIPFSDPLADGATIQSASYQALKNGVTPELCLDMATQIRRQTDIPMVFMSYYNPIFSYGKEAFCQASAKAGIDGLIIPDLPPEEGHELEAAASASGLDLIYLLSPNSSEERIDLVVNRSTGFTYIVSVTGVTGARQTLPQDLEEFIARVRERTTLPLCVGFGISTPEQAARLGSIADGIIVGSRIIQLLDEHSSSELAELVMGLRKALDTC